MLLGTLGAGLLRNLLIGKGVDRKGNGHIRTGDANKGNFLYRLIL